MTALCGGGPSAPKPGTDSAIALGGTAIDAFVTKLGHANLAGLIGVIASGIAFSTDLFCGTDPPADPGLTLQDIVDAGNPADPLTFFPAAQKIKDWFLHQYWWEVCMCTSTTTPAPPPVGLPPGLGNNNGLPSTTTTGPCFSNSYTITLVPDPATGSGFGHGPIMSQLFPGSWLGTCQPEPPPYHDCSGTWANPPAWDHFVWTLTSDRPSPGFGVGVEATFQTGPGTPWGFTQWMINTGATTQSFTVLPSDINIAGGYSNLFFSAASGDRVNTYHLTIQVDFYCVGPNNLNGPCCAPDPLVQNYLQQITAMLQWLIGNQPIPNPLLAGYTHGTVHGPFTGSGQFATVGTPLALLVQVTGTGPAQGQEVGSPDRWFNLGWITPEIVGTPYAPQRIVYLTQQMQLPQLVDVINYTLPGGVTATVTELISTPAGALAQT